MAIYKMGSDQKPHKYDYKAPKEYKQTEERKLRATYDWTQKAKQIKEDSQFLCAVCRDQGEITYSNLEVHHITKLKDDPDGLLDDDNLICLCAYHHHLADRGKLTKTYLLKLAKKR